MPRHKTDIGRVANLWALADFMGFPTTNLIASRLNITQRHAVRLVAEARTAGLIPSRKNKNNGQGLGAKIGGRGRRTDKKAITTDAN